MFDSMKGRILVVQGRIRFSMAEAAALSKAGIQSWTATTAEQCLGLLRREPTDLVLLDILSQDIDDPGVYERIRRICPRVPVIFTPNCSQPNARAVANQLHADGYLVFPMNEDEFVARVRCLLLLGRQSSAAGRSGFRGFAESFAKIRRQEMWNRRVAITAKQGLLNAISFPVTERIEVGATRRQCAKKAHCHD